MDWSYIAGYFDGEGTVGHHEMARGGMTRSIAWMNTHLDSLKAMQEFMGVGRISERFYRPGSISKKRQYVLVVTNKVALLYAINNMMPMLIIKRERAEKLRRFLIDHVDETRMFNFGKVAAVPTDQLLAWYEAGESHGDIARRVGVTRLSVLQAFRVRGIQSRPQPIATSMRQKGVSKSLSTRERMKASRQAMWADPEFRARQAQLREKNGATATARMGSSMKAKWADPEFRARMFAVRKEQWSKPENKAAMAKAQQARRAREKQESH